MGAFSFGRSRGVVEGVCGALGVPIEFVSPSSWKRIIGLPPGKETAGDDFRGAAIGRWPTQAGLFARVKDHGRSDAALIAVAGLVRKAGNIASSKSLPFGFSLASLSK